MSGYFNKTISKHNNFNKKKTGVGGKKIPKRNQNMSNYRALGMDIGSSKLYEHKNIVTQNAATVISTGIVYATAVPGQGTTSSQRIGDNIKLVAFTLSYSCTLNTALPSDVLRIIVVQCIGAPATPSVTTLLNATGSGSVTAWSQYNINVRRQYHVLYDKFHVMCPSAQNTRICQMVQFMPKIKDIEFIAGGTTVYSGQPYVIMLTNSATSSTTVDYQLFTWFTD